MRLYSAEGAGLQQDKVVVRIQPLRCLTNDLIERTEVIRALQRKCFEHVRKASSAPGAPGRSGESGIGRKRVVIYRGSDFKQVLIHSSAEKLMPCVRGFLSKRVLISIKLFDNLVKMIKIWLLS